MTLLHDMNAAYGIARSGAVVKRLCCPECGGTVRLTRELDPNCFMTGALYTCRACLSEFDKLAELAVKP